MKAKPFIRVLLFLLALFLLAGCSRGDRATFAREAGGYRERKSGTVYKPVANYRALAVDKDALLGTYTSPGGTVVSLYTVAGLSGVIADGDYALFASPEAVVPAFADLPLDGADLCYSGEITVPFLRYEAADAERIRADLLAATPLSDRRLNKDAVAARYDLVFRAAGLPLAYQLVYVTFDDEVLIREELVDGEIPDLYPGIRAEKAANASGKEEAVFHFGTRFVRDLSAGVCYPVSKLD